MYSFNVNVDRILLIINMFAAVIFTLLVGWNLVPVVYYVMGLAWAIILGSVLVLALSMLLIGMIYEAYFKLKGH